jgi:hypothetical protein
MILAKNSVKSKHRYIGIVPLAPIMVLSIATFGAGHNAKTGR